MTVSHSTDRIETVGIDDSEQLKADLLDGKIPIAVYGLGKVGLPIAAVFADVTSNVIGVDVDPTVVETINAAEVPFDHEPGLAQLIEHSVEHDGLVATTDGQTAAQRATIHLIIVPVGTRSAGRTEQQPPWVPPNDRQARSVVPDLRSLQDAVETVAQGLAPGDLVLVESTVPPGTTAKLVEPCLSEKSGLDGEFRLAYSPERISSGRAVRDVKGAYPTVVGGIDRESTQLASVVYETITEGEVITVSDATTAEAVKLFEGVYRDVNIALANELGRATDSLGIDVLEAIDAANTQPYCAIHRPGAGVGGHCIPVYPHLLQAAVTIETPLMETARSVNDAMPSFVVARTIDELESNGMAVKGSTIAVLGITYRPGIPETSNSPAGPIIEGLTASGAEVFAIDPELDEPTVFGVPRIELDQLESIEPDAVVVVTPHTAFIDRDWSTYAGLVVDCRDAIDGDLPWRYTIGRGRH